MKCSKLARALAVLCLLGAAGCGGNAALGTVNPNFPDLSDGSTAPGGSINPDDTEQVAVVEPGPSDQAGKIGTIADRDPSHVLCVVIDPSAGENADLEVCDADRVNTETESVNGLCPDADVASRCASSNAGSGPDFCQVTGASDYAFVLINPTSQAVSVAYQVIDVTGYPNKSCADLNITEDSIRADDF
jgi:hypothetical protein